ncbi:MAG: cyclic nucleotide-binding domain-containing protein [Verrucomicrobia bacterium]|nr:cyclic nucleotide-binding domain-containing protein [Verrucomicrobiota bacterium]
MTPTLEPLLAESPLFKGFDPAHLSLLAASVTNVRYNAGDYLFREGETSSQFYVLRSGKVALEINAPGRGPLIIQTLGEGDLLGWSSMVPPYTKHFCARAIELTRALAFDGAKVRQLCEGDPKLGYELLKRLSAVMGQRLQATRLQVLDLYGNNR